jgi:hypothetical protein
MLPGPSAFAITRAYLLVYLLGMLVWVPFVFLLLASDNENRTPTFWWLFGGLFVLLGVGFVVGLIGRLRRLTERRAGYTTVLNSPLDRDLLDRHTGAVLWKAGDPAPRQPGILGIIRGDQGGAGKPRRAGEAAFPAPSPLSRVLWLLPYAAAIVVVVISVSVAKTQAQPVTFVMVYLGFVALAALLIGLVVLVTTLTLGRRIRIIAGLRPAAMIFISMRSRGLSAAVAELGTTTSASGRFPVVATDSALEFWGSTDTVPWMSIPWSDIVSVDPGSAAFGRSTFRAVTIGVQHGDRKVVLTLPLYGRQGTFNAPVPWANQIFDELQFHLAAR